MACPIVRRVDPLEHARSAVGRFLDATGGRIDPVRDFDPWCREHGEDLADLLDGLAHVRLGHCYLTSEGPISDGDVAWIDIAMVRLIDVEHRRWMLTPRN
jgi:hypothetical protein